VTTPQAQREPFGWLVDDFVNRVAGVAHALVVSAEGMRLTCPGTELINSPQWRPDW
jgi:uncharacterized protein